MLLPRRGRQHYKVAEPIPTLLLCLVLAIVRQVSPLLPGPEDPQNRLHLKDLESRPIINQPSIRSQEILLQTQLQNDQGFKQCKNPTQTTR